MATFWEIAAHSVYLCFFVYIFPTFLMRDFGSDCISLWSLLIFYFIPISILSDVGKT